MKRIVVTGAVLVASAMLGGCFDGGPTEVHDADADTDDISETPIADSLKKPMDKAAAVEDMAMQRKADMDKRLAEMEGDDADVDP